MRPASAGATTISGDKRGRIRAAQQELALLRDPASVGQLVLVRARCEEGAQPAARGERADLRGRLAWGLRLGREDLAVSGLVRRRDRGRSRRRGSRGERRAARSPLSSRSRSSSSSCAQAARSICVPWSVVVERAIRRSFSQYPQTARALPEVALSLRLGTVTSQTTAIPSQCRSRQGTGAALRSCRRRRCRRASAGPSRRPTRGPRGARRPGTIAARGDPSARRRGPPGPWSRRPGTSRRSRRMTKSG